MVGFLWQSLKFLPRTAKTFQKLGRKCRNVMMKMKIQNYIYCCGWIPLNTLKFLPRTAKTFQNLGKKECSRRRKRLKHTFTAMVGVLWKPLIFLPRTAKSFQNIGKKNRKIKMDMKIQTYIHCYAWIPLTILNKSATHCQFFSRSWQKNTEISKHIKRFKLTFTALVGFHWKPLKFLPRTAKIFQNLG